MADKEINIKVTTEADVADLNNLNDILQSGQENADELGQRISTALESATSEVEELTQELANIEMGESDANFDEVSTQLEEATDKATSLENALNSIQSNNLDEANQSANQLGDGLNNAKTNAEELSGSMGLIESTMLMDMANQIGTLGTQAEGMAQDMNNASISVGQLATQTGIAEPQMISLINNISNVTFPNEEAMMYVKSLDQIGVSSDNLGKSATDLDKINDAFGLGANKVNSLGQELSVLGVDMNNVSSSFNALAYANANTVGGMDNYYNFLRRFDAEFAQLGLNVDQASIIIAGATQKFGGGRTALSGLSTALKECNGDTRALEQALGLQAGSLENASQITGQYEGQLQQLADEEMAHKTGIERLNAVWEDMSLALSPLLSPLASFIGLIGSIGQTALAINSILTLAETFGILKTETIAQTVANWALAISEWAVAHPLLLLVAIILLVVGALIYLYYNNETVRDGINRLGEALTWIGQQIYNVVVGAIQYLSNAFKQFTTQMGLNTNDWKQAILGFILFLPQLPLRIGVELTNAIARVLGFKGNFVQSMATSASNAVNSFVSWIVQLPGKLNEELNAMLDRARQFALDIANILTGGGAGMVIGWLTGSGEHSPGKMYDALVGELIAMANAPAEHMTELATAVAELGLQMVNSLMTSLVGFNLDTLMMAMNNFWSMMQGVVNYILSVGGLLPQSIEITGNSIIDTILRVVMFFATIPVQIALHLANIISRVVSFGGQFASSFANAGMNAVSQFSSSINNLGSALANEISGMISDATNFVGQIGSILYNAGVNAVQNFLNGLQRHSPGKMQREFQAEIVEMGDNVPNDSRNLIRNVNRLGQDITDTFDADLKLKTDFSNGNHLQQLSDTINLDETGFGNITFNLYGDVDNDERMSKFVEAVKRELHWNNKTANRSV